jgi:hypothetical protein
LVHTFAHPVPLDLKPVAVMHDVTKPPERTDRAASSSTTCWSKSNSIAISAFSSSAVTKARGPAFRRAG